MGKIHLLMRKEDIEPDQIAGKIVVVFDILLATSTITTALSNAARAVVPVLNGEEALREAQGRKSGTYVLAGEYAGVTLDGFMSPSPLQLRNQVKDQTMILSTTNGTVAIKGAAPAKKVLAASLLNGWAVSETIQQAYQDETVVVVCSGSMERFCLEDFYGAGYFLDCLVAGTSDWELTDAARAALLFYQGNDKDSTAVLYQSRVGSMLARHGMEEDMAYVAQRGILPVVPYLKDDAVVADADEKSLLTDKGRRPMSP